MENNIERFNRSSKYFFYFDMHDSWKSVELRVIHLKTSLEDKQTFHMKSSFLFNFQMEKDETSWLEVMCLTFISYLIYLTALCFAKQNTQPLVFAVTLSISALTVLSNSQLLIWTKFLIRSMPICCWCMHSENLRINLFLLISDLDLTSEQIWGWKSFRG